MIGKNISGVASSSFSKIVRTNLNWWYDAMSNKSYPETGTSWFDLSASVNTGTLTGSPTFSTGNGGYFTFSGANYVSIPYSAGTFNIGTSDFTFCSWYYQTSSALYQRLFSLGLFATAGNFEIETPGTDILVHVNGGYLTYTAASAVNAWRHLVVSRISGNVTVYINGSSIGTGSQTGTINNTSTPLLASYDGAGNGLIGRVASVQLYNGLGLSSTQALQNYYADRRRFGL